MNLKQKKDIINIMRGNLYDAVMEEDHKRVKSLTADIQWRIKELNRLKYSNLREGLEPEDPMQREHRFQELYPCLSPYLI